MKFTVRRIMLAVACISIAIWATHWQQMHQRYRHEEEMHRQMQWGCEWMAYYLDPNRSPYCDLRRSPGQQNRSVNGLDGLVFSPSGEVRDFNGPRIEGAERTALAASYVRKAAEHGRLRRAFRRAALYPWFSAPSHTLPCAQVWAARRHAITARIIEMEAAPAPSSRDRERTAYYTKLKEKYENVASHLWQSLPPDLPGPK